MIIIPAIDIMDGKTVRLTGGDYGKVSGYSVTPAEAAIQFFNEGARYLHVVDLDGARLGREINENVISEIVSKTALSVQVGGGIRTERQVEKYLDCGASRVVLGTAAVTDKNFLKECLSRYGEKIAVGVDAVNGCVAIDGWKKQTALDSVAFCKELAYIGVRNIIYTDISKDGALSGTNLDIYDVLCQIDNINLIASGGITYPEEIKKLSKSGIYGAIIGKALYENRLTLRDALKAAENDNVG